MRWLWSRRLRPYVLLAAGTSLVLNLMLLVPAIYMVQVFDRVFASRSLETLAMLSALVALALALAYAMDVVRARALAHAGTLLDRCLSPSALRTMLAQAAQPGRATRADTLRDIGHLRGFLAGSGVLALFDAPWVPLYLAAITLMHPVLGATAAVGALALFALALVTDRLTRGDTERAQQQARSMQRHVQSLVRHAEVIAGMGMGKAAANTWGERHDELLRRRTALAARAARLGAAARIARQGVQAGLLGIGAWLVVGESASPGIMVAATILLGRALQPVEQLISGWKSLIEARSAWRRLEEPGSAAATTAGVALPAPTGRLEVEHVVFGAQAQRPAHIRGVSFALAAGESLGLVGPSAAGKSTLLRILLGVWKPQAGTVRLDGADIAQWDRDALGTHVGYLPQDVELFPGTVAENIARFAAVDDAQVVRAAQLAHAHDMILRLPQGYDTPVGEAGTMLSGGQRQRIALARALYGEPRLVVLDEPNANLDADGEAALAAALGELRETRTTVIVVTHRPALLSNLDKVAVLKDGRIEAFGPPASVNPRLRAVGRSPVAPAASASVSLPVAAV